jgi:hypothetical protein
MVDASTSPPDAAPATPVHSPPTPYRLQMVVDEKKMLRL